MSYGALLVGLGQIGMGYDYEQDPRSDEIVLTHAQAVSSHEGFRLIGGIDPSAEKRQKFNQKFKVPAYVSLRAAISELQIDIVIISASTQTHFDLCQAVFKLLKPKLILLEKPLSFSVKESLRIIELSERERIPIAVNYFRAYEPAFVSVTSKLRNGELGFPLRAVARYSSGIINNGSHWLQFFSSFLGAITEVCVGALSTHGRMDFNAEIKVKYEKGEVYLIPFDAPEYFLFDLDIYGPQGKILIESSGKKIDCYLVENDKNFPGAICLREDPETIATQMSQYQKFVYDEIFSFLQTGTMLSCSAETLRPMLEVFSKIESRLGAEFNG